MPATPTDGPMPGADPHAGHDMGAMHWAHSAQQPTNPHAGHAMSAAPTEAQPAGPHTSHDLAGAAPAGHGGAVGTNLPAGAAPAPTAFPGSAAGRFYGEQAMASAMRDLKREHGGGVWNQLLFNIAEAQVRDGRDGYRWDGEAWIGGDINRLVLRTEGAGEFRRAPDEAQFEVLYSRALDPYVNLQAGVRYDVSPDPDRAYASIGFEALAPYWFDVETTLFLSDKGDLLAQAEAWYDQRLTNWWVLQPRAELNFAAQDIPEHGVGSGLSEIELGLRLRYEFRREFAPYLGVSWDRKVGDTARFARAEGEGTGGFSFLAGLRVWF